MEREERVIEDKGLVRRAAIADIVGTNLYPLIVGSCLDYAAGLDVKGIVAARASGAVVNTVTGAPYGYWREKVCSITNTDENSSWLRRRVADLAAFNTFQVPLYGALVGIGSLVSEGRIDFEKMQDGMAYLAMISPAIGPTMGWFMDGVRKVFGVKSAAEGQYSKNN